MARGFESKDIEFQQAEKDRREVPAPRRTLTPEERAASDERHSLELTITRVRRELASASSAAHRRMLEQALADLEQRRSPGSHVTG